MSRTLLLPCLLALTVAASPTADLVMTYSMPQIGLVLTQAYLEYGAIDALGSALFGVKVYRVNYATGLAGANTPGASDGITMSGLIAIPTVQRTDLPIAALLRGTTTNGTSVPSNAFNHCDSTGTELMTRISAVEKAWEGAMKAGNVPAFSNTSSVFDSVCLPDMFVSPIATFGMLAAASMGYVAIAPDGMGFGASISDPTSYLIAEGYAISTFNLHAAARILVPVLQQGASVGSSMVVAGYSEGGYGSLAVLRESQKAEWTEADVSVAAVFPGAGPYDLVTTEVQRLRTPETITKPSYAIYLTYSYWITYGLSTIFNPDYLNNLQAWYDGSLASDQIDAYIQTATGNNFLEIINATELAIADAGGQTSFTMRLAENSLTTGWTPGNAGIHLCHGEADEVVDVTNAQIVAGNMAGANVSLETISSNMCGSHIECAPYCLKHAISGIWTQQGKWSGALGVDAPSNAAMIGVFAGVVLVGILIGYAIWNSNRNSDNYEMIA